MLVEITHCPFCNRRIQVPFSDGYRLFGSELGCVYCEESFIVNCAHLIDDEDYERGNFAIAYEVRQKMTSTSQTTIADFEEVEV